MSPSGSAEGAVVTPGAIVIAGNASEANGPALVPLANVTICVVGSHVGLPPAFHSVVVSRGVMEFGRCASSW
jgi:hypothetical protein